MKNLKRIMAYTIIVLYISIIGIVSNSINNITKDNNIILSFIAVLSYVFLSFLTDKLKDLTYKNKEMFLYKACAVSFVVFAIICGILCLVEFNTKEAYIAILSFIMPATSASMALSFVYAILHLLVTNATNIGNPNRL